MYCYDDRVGAISPISIVNALKGGQSWNYALSPPFFFLLGDDRLVLYINVSTRVPGRRGQPGCLWA